VDISAVVFRYLCPFNPFLASGHIVAHIDGGFHKIRSYGFQHFHLLFAGTGKSAVVFQSQHQTDLLRRFRQNSQSLNDSFEGLRFCFFIRFQALQASAEDSGYRGARLCSYLHPRFRILYFLLKLLLVRNVKIGGQGQAGKLKTAVLQRRAYAFGCILDISQIPDMKIQSIHIQCRSLAAQPVQIPPFVNITPMEAVMTNRYFHLAFLQIHLYISEYSIRSLSFYRGLRIRFSR
jgi:hypothetical protein